MSLNHCCELQGCYIKKHTPDWGFLDVALSGKRRVSDIDGIVEVKGNLLMIEWKGSGVKIPKGQEYLYINATRKNHLTYIPETPNDKST